jgi:hypothetical protein
MKKRSKKLANNRLRKSSRLGVIGIVLAIVVLAVGTMAAVSMRANKAPAGKADISMTDQSKQTHLATVKGQVVEVNNQTGEFRPLTAEEQQQMADGIKNLVNQSDEGLKQVQRPDGSVSMNLEGRFQNVSVARKEADGSISQSCVNSPETAGAFFGIDPDKFRDKPKAGGSVKTVVSRVPGKGEVK